MRKGWKKDATKGAFIGLLAGLAVAIGGAIKDSPAEGFKPVTFMRSPVVGTLVGTVIGVKYHAPIPLVFLGTIGGERIVVESYKLVRAQVPSKFSIGEWGMARPRKA